MVHGVHTTVQRITDDETEWTQTSESSSSCSLAVVRHRWLRHRWLWRVTSVHWLTDSRRTFLIDKLNWRWCLLRRRRSKNFRQWTAGYIHTSAVVRHWCRRRLCDISVVVTDTVDNVTVAWPVQHHHHHYENSYTHTRWFNGHPPGEPGLAGSPWISLSTVLLNTVPTQTSHGKHNPAWSYK